MLWTHGLLFVIPTPLHQLGYHPEVVWPASPGRLAALSREHPLPRRCNSSTPPEEILAWDRSAGRVVDYELGVDGAGWRAAWALLGLDAGEQAKGEVGGTVMLPLQEQCWLAGAKELVKLPSKIPSARTESHNGGCICFLHRAIAGVANRRMPIAPDLVPPDGPDILAVPPRHRHCASNRDSRSALYPPRTLASRAAMTR